MLTLVPSLHTHHTQVLHVARELPVTITLKNILAKSFPSEYADRATEEAAAVDGGGADALFSLPVFVMTALLPGEKMALNIFEPMCVFEAVLLCVVHSVLCVHSTRGAACVCHVGIAARGEDTLNRFGPQVYIDISVCSGQIKPC